MFYESKHSLNSNLFKFEIGNDFSFPPHLHGSFEFITVTEGEMTVTIDKTQYILKAGNSVLIFPNQIHSLSTEKQSRHILCIFSPQLVRSYNNIYANKIPTDNMFVLDKFYVEQYATLHNSKNILKVKGFLYSVCAEFDLHATYVERKNKNEDLLFKIFQFVENNYMTDCSLDALATGISYHSVYLSRYFKHHTGLTFTDYVNRYRINEAAYILKNSQQKILDIAYDCGLDSLRSFNRNFKAIMGITPNEYRNQHSTL